MKNSLKCQYVESCLEKYKNDPKKLWREIRTFWLGKKNGNARVGNIQGAKSDLDEANILNDHFVNTGDRMQASMRSLDSDNDVFNFQSYPPTFEFDDVVLDDVVNAINKLNASKSASLDGMTSFMLKSCKTAIAPILLYLYNLSIKTRSFPTAWKLTKVRPLYKSGSADDCGNFRPISIIPTIGKVMERLVHSQCSVYLEDRNVISETQ